MGFSNPVAYFVILTTAEVLNLNGKTIFKLRRMPPTLCVQRRDSLLLYFSAKEFGTGLLALLGLAGSAAYSVSEAMRWRSGLEIKP